MAIDERAHHRLHRKLEEILGPEEAGTLMSQLPHAGWGALATRADMENLEHRLTATMERLARRLVMWTSSMVLAAAALAFAAGKFG